MAQGQEPVFGEKLEGVDYRARTGVYGVVPAGEKVAAVRTPTGCFLIGGGIEQGESREECLRREFLEETGYTIEIGEFIGKASGYYYSRDFARHMHGTGYFYRVRLLEKTAEPVEADHELVFLQPRECLRLLNYDHQRWAVRRALGQRTEDPGPEKEECVKL